MRGEIIAIGDELTTGQRLDTNSQWLAERLTDAGVDVLYHTTVGDDLQANIMVFAHAIERADVVVATGGLGPTADDLTREALAAAAGVKLERDDASLEHIRQMFESRGRDMPERNALQAMFPVGASAIPNEHGTAPGVQMAAPRDGRTACHVYALPGVPAEMKPMWQETVGPAIAALHERPRVIRHRCLKCFGVGESHMEEMLPGLLDRDRQPRVGITVHKATITLRITATAETERACRAAMEPTEQAIREKLGTLVFGEEDEELQDVVLRGLIQRSETLAVADHASHGLLAQWLSEADQAGLALRHAELGPGTPLDEPSAASLAQRMRTEHNTTYALVIAPAATVHTIESAVVALAYDGGVQTKLHSNASHPDIVNDRAAKLALNALRMHWS